MNDFLYWLALGALATFASLRVWWIYRRGVGQMFWQTPRARYLYGVAAVVVVLALSSIFIGSSSRWVLLIAIPLVYVLLSFTAVKVDERAIIAKAIIARWPDIARLHYDEKSGDVLVATRRSWQRVKVRVPPERLSEFRKIIAAKGMALSSSAAGQTEETLV